MKTVSSLRHSNLVELVGENIKFERTMWLLIKCFMNCVLSNRPPLIIGGNLWNGTSSSQALWRFLCGDCSAAYGLSRLDDGLVC